MHVYHVHEALYLDFETHCPLVRGSGHRAGSIRLYNENVEKLRKSFSLLPYIFEKNAWL